MKKLILLICCLFNLSYSAEISTSQSIYAKLTNLIPRSQDLISSFESYTKDVNLQSSIKIFLGSIFSNGQKDINFLTNSLKIALSFLEKANATQAEEIIKNLKPILTNDANFAGIQNIDSSNFKDFNIGSLSNFYEGQLKKTSNFDNLNDFTFNYLQSMLSKKELKDTYLSADNLAKIFNIYTENPNNKDLVLFALEQILNPEAPKIALEQKPLNSLSNLENLFNQGELRRKFAISVLKNDSANFNEINDLFNANYKLFFEPVLNQLTADQINYYIPKLVNEIPRITEDLKADVSKKILRALAQLPISDDFGIIAVALKGANFLNPNLTKENLANIGKAMHDQNNRALSNGKKVKLEADFLSKVLEEKSSLNAYQLTKVLNFLADKLTADNNLAEINKLVNVAVIIASLNPNVINSLTNKNNEDLVKFLTENKLGKNKNGEDVYYNLGEDVYYNQIKDFTFDQLTELKKIISGNQKITNLAIKFLNNNQLNAVADSTNFEKIRELLVELNKSSDAVNLTKEILPQLLKRFQVNGVQSFEKFADTLLKCTNIGNFLTRVNASLNDQSGSDLFRAIVNNLSTNPDVRNTFLQNLIKNAGSNSKKPFSDSLIIEALHASGVRQSLFKRFFAKILPDGIISKFGWTPDIPKPVQNKESQTVSVDQQEILG